MLPVMEKPKVSLVIITLNEELNIERCLKSASWVDDIVVVDSGSIDKTVSIAETLGARVYQEAWRGFRAQKEFATSLAKYDWVLSLDADEALSEDASREMQNFLHDTKDFSALSSPRLSYHLGKWIHHGGWYPDRQIRLYDRRRAKWAGGNIHEKIVADKILNGHQNILHWVFRSLSHQVITNDRYSTEGAKDLFERGKKFRWWKLIFKPPTKFIETYIVKAGFLDGMAGFVISVGAAYSVFLKFSKLYYMQKDKK